MLWVYLIDKDFKGFKEFSTFLFPRLPRRISPKIGRYVKDKFDEEQPTILKSETNEAIIAWRIWRVVANGNHAILRSCVTGEAWETGAPMYAKTTVIAHQLYNGVHAYKMETRPDKYAYSLWAESNGDMLVHGKIALWGKVIEHEEGYRAEFAYPIHIFIPERENSEAIAQAIRSDYGCEATVIRNPVQ